MKSLDFEDHPFTVETWDQPCEFCGATDTYLDEVVIDDQGSRLWICSDTDYCNQRQQNHPLPHPPLATLTLNPSPVLGEGL